MSKDKLNLIELKIGDELFSVLKEINSNTQTKQKEQQLNPLVK